MSQHPEIITAPFTVWIAPVGTAFPGPGQIPASPWRRLGRHGDRSQASGGVTVAHTSEVALSKPAGSLQAQFAFPVDDSLTVRFELLDMTAETYADALGNTAIRPPADAGGNVLVTTGLSFSSHQLPLVALLVRGPSPYSAGRATQFEIPRAVSIGRPAPVFSRTAPSALRFEFAALRNPLASSADEVFGRFCAALAVDFIQFIGSTQSGRLGIVSADQAGNFEREA